MTDRVESVPVGDAQLWTATSGGGPALVLAHGGPGMSDNLGPVAGMVAHLATVHRYDQRACGRSTGSGAEQTVASAVADLDALRDRWGHDRWVVGGHSWGAALALCYALAHPGRTRAVVCLSGAAVTPPPRRQRARSRMERLSPAERAEFGRLEGPAAAGDPEAVARFSQLLWRTDFSDPRKVPDFDVAPLYAFPRNAEAGEALRASLAERIRTGLAEEARDVRVPVLVLHGDDDPLPVESAIELADRLPQAQLVVLPGVGHTPWLEDDAGVRTALRQFLAALPD